VVVAGEEDEPLVRRGGAPLERPRVGRRQVAVFARAEDEERHAQPAHGAERVELRVGPAAVGEVLLAGHADHARDARAEPRAGDHARDPAERRAHEEDLVRALALELRHGACEVSGEATALGADERRLRQAEVAVVEDQDAEAGGAQDLGVGQPAAQIGRRLVGEDDAGLAVAQRRAVEEDAVRRVEPADLRLDSSAAAALAERGKAASLGLEHPGRPSAAACESDDEEKGRGGRGSQRRRRTAFKSFSRISSARRIRSSTSSCSAWM